ncbi:MAG: M14 family zinc carboxypeptidase, partial [Bacteroidota bacterium]
MNQLTVLFLSLIFFCTACQTRIEDQEINTENGLWTIDGVSASNQFAGARLDSFTLIAPDHFQATISPENIPINASAWYAFKLWTDQARTIQLSLKYTHHKHRYIPKFSKNGQTWKTLEVPVQLNDDSTSATMTIPISQDTLWVAAQEVISSQNTYAWVDSLLSKHSTLSQEIAGKSTLGKSIYVLNHEPPGVEKAVVLIARQHPPEIPGGAIAFMAFLEELFQDNSVAEAFRQSYNLYVFPLLNPDGADLGNWRHNANGKDLNRDWIDFTQAETQTARDFVNQKIEEGRKITFGIDFHTSYSGPYLLILDSLNEASLETKIIPKWRSKILGDSLDMLDYRR